MFRAVLLPAREEAVRTPYGVLRFVLRGVRVVDGSGAQVGYFVCEDDPADFDVKASEAGWVRVGVGDGCVLVKPSRSVRAGRRRRWWPWLLFVYLEVFGCAHV